MSDNAEAVDHLSIPPSKKWSRLWDLVHRNTGAQILQHNFPLENERTAGRVENRYAWSKSRFLRALNDRLWEKDGAAIRVVDVADLADRLGQQHWTEPRWQHYGKFGFNPALIGNYARLLAGTLRALWGPPRNVWWFDLDNTLWGGFHRRRRARWHSSRKRNASGRGPCRLLRLPQARCVIGGCRSCGQ